MMEVSCGRSSESALAQRMVRMVKKKANRKPRDQNTSRCIVESDEDRDPSTGTQHCGFNRQSEEGRERPKVHHQVQPCCEPEASVETHHLSSSGQSTPHYLTGDPSNHSGHGIDQMARVKGARQANTRRILQQVLEPEASAENQRESSGEVPIYPKLKPSPKLQSPSYNLRATFLYGREEPDTSSEDKWEVSDEYDDAHMHLEEQPSLSEKSICHDFGRSPNHDSESRKRRRVRGPTLLEEIWSQPEGRKIQVEFNNLGQPIGREARILSNFLGTMARKPGLMPLLTAGWRDFPKENKISLFTIVKSKFVIPESGEEWVLRSLGKKWKEYKCLLKTRYFEGCKSNREALNNRPDHITPSEWTNLVTFWNSSEAKERSAKNKKSRAKMIPHTAGSKSFARLMAEKAKDGVELSRAEFFMETHRARKDGRPMDDESARIINAILQKLKEHSISSEQGRKYLAPVGDIYSQVMATEKPCRVRRLGLGPTRTGLWDPSISPLLQKVLDSRGAENYRVQKLEEEIRNLKENLAKVEAQLSKIISNLGLCSLEEETPSGLSDLLNKQAEAPRPVVVPWGFLSDM